jgi:hypothetical protein
MPGTRRGNVVQRIKRFIETASTGLGNSESSKAPVVLKMRPSCWAAKLDPHLMPLDSDLNVDAITTQTRVRLPGWEAFQKLFSLVENRFVGKAWLEAHPVAGIPPYSGAQKHLGLLLR